MTDPHFGSVDSSVTYTLPKLCACLGVSRRRSVEILHYLGLEALLKNTKSPLINGHVFNLAVQWKQMELVAEVRGKLEDEE